LENTSTTTPTKLPSIEELSALIKMARKEKKKRQVVLVTGEFFDIIAVPKDFSNEFGKSVSLMVNYLSRINGLSFIERYKEFNGGKIGH